MALGPMNYEHFEADLAGCIRTHAERYVDAVGKGVTTVGFQPGNQQQSSVDFDKYCYDLILRASNSRILALEVKYLGQAETKFHHFPEIQQNALLDLESAKLPIFICYNNAADYADAPGRFYSLLCCLSSKPSRILDPRSGLVWKGEHQPLRDQVWSSLLSSDAPICAAMGETLLARPKLSLFTARHLIFAYNPELKRLVTLSGIELEQALRGYVRKIKRDNRPMEDLDNDFPLPPPPSRKPPGSTPSVGGRW